jgi:hypothetical protein
MNTNQTSEKLSQRSEQLSQENASQVGLIQNADDD